MATTIISLAALVACSILTCHIIRLTNALKRQERRISAFWDCLREHSTKFHVVNSRLYDLEKEDRSTLAGQCWMEQQQVPNFMRRQGD